MIKIDKTMRKGKVRMKRSRKIFLPISVASVSFEIIKRNSVGWKEGKSLQT
jgi:hypothetical protein